MSPTKPRPLGAERQRRARQRKHLTLDELARRIGVSKESVRLWEKGRGIRGRYLVALAKELDLRPEDLVEGREGAVASVSRAVDKEIEAKVEEVLKAIAALSKQADGLAALLVRQRLGRDPDFS